MSEKEPPRAAARPGVVTLPGLGVLDLTPICNRAWSPRDLERLGSEVAKMAIRDSALGIQFESLAQAILRIPKSPPTIEPALEAPDPLPHEEEPVQVAPAAVQVNAVEDSSASLAEPRELNQAALEHQQGVPSVPLAADAATPARARSPVAPVRAPSEPSRIVTLAYAAKHWFRCSRDTLVRDVNGGTWACTRLTRQRFRFEVREVVSVSPEAEEDALGLHSGSD